MCKSCLKKFYNQKNDKDKELNELAEIAHKEKIEKFVKTEGKLVQDSSGLNKTTNIKESTSVNNMSTENKSKLPSFWIPSLAPESKNKTLIKKPVSIYSYLN